MQPTHDTYAPISIFYSYSHKDKVYRDKLKTHLSVMRRQGLISEWHDQDIMPGQEWHGEINKHLKTADVILLLVSPDFLDSDYCSTVEMKLAIQRHEAGEAYIIPIILRPCDWRHPPLNRFHALPHRAKPVVHWKIRDEAYDDIAKGIRRVVSSLHKSKGGTKVTLKDEHSISLTQPTSVAKPLPKGTNRSLNKVLQKRRDDRSIGEKIQVIVRLIVNSFSFGEIGKRAKGFSLILLCLFTILNTMVLPSLVYQWTNSVISVLSFVIFGLLFLIGITNKSGTAAYFATVAFFIIWSIIGFICIIGYYHISLPSYWLVLIISLLSLLQLELFRPRNRRRRFLRII